ncbi:MAG: DUF58 domain-containing protein [Acidobacteriaceae bacterium]|nr:DUF58 domain-containing protein [Acidobacteriaceae bacterium]
MQKTGAWIHFLHSNIPEVWVRFLLALAGLVLAFAAALFSTVSRESGNLWATLILASSALVLATIVGLTTVPYLAQRVAAARIRDALDYEITRIGIVYILIVLLIGVAALNTGNNLLYIIVAAMLAAILASGVGSAIVLRNLQLQIQLPEHVFAKRPTIAHVVVRNRRRWLPSFSVNVVSLKRKRTLMPWRWVKKASESVTERKNPHSVREPNGFRRPGNSGKEIFEGAAFFPYLPAQGEMKADVQLCFAARGVYRQEIFGIATRFPFAFLTKTRRVSLEKQAIVYPSVEATDELFEVLPLVTGEFESFVRGRGYDLYRIREYMPDDSARHVDWKATAKSGSVKVREFSREDERKLRIVFDNPAPGVLSEPAYESAVAMIASLSWHFAAEHADVSFVAPEYRGRPEVYAFLEYLAMVQPQTDRSVVDDLKPSDAYNIIFTTRPRGSISTALWSCSYLIFLGTSGTVIA